MYHVPVMLEEAVEGLNIRPGGIYVDVTFGGGGHSRKILEQLTTGHLLAFDQDPDAVANAGGFESNNFTFIESNFRFLKRYLKVHGYPEVDGILADLGISSHQINAPERGFSTRFDAPLDMRMDKGSAKTASNILKNYNQEQLHKIFGMYGEVKNAKTLAATVVQERINREINTTGEFKDVISHLAPRGKENKYFAQVFQALRIEVNEELKALEDLLEQSASVLNKDGRLVIISYHSLEDRLVKNFIAQGKFHGEAEKDLYGNVNKPLEAVTRKPLQPSEKELIENPRSRSAKLRIARKI